MSDELEIKQAEYGFDADEVFKTALADKIVKIINNIPESLEGFNIESTRNSFKLNWREKKNE